MNTLDLSAGTSLRSRARTITETDLVSFAAITGDWHPQHVDAEWAAESRFGERIAHGMLVLSYSIGLMGFDPDRVVALRGIDSLIFKRPVAIGETIRVEADVEDIRPIDPEHELVELRWRVLGGGDLLALRARITIVHRPAPVPGTSRNAHDPRRQKTPGGVLRNGEVPGPGELYGERVLL
jgi:acyl dehydratase